MNQKLKFTKANTKSFDGDKLNRLIYDEYGKMGTPMSKEEVQMWMDSTGNFTHNPAGELKKLVFSNPEKKTNKKH